MADLPKRCRYHGETFVVIEYMKGDRRDLDEFLIENGHTPADWVRRSRLKFLRPVVKASVAVDEALDLLGSLGVEEVAS